MLILVYCKFIASIKSQMYVLRNVWSHVVNILLLISGTYAQQTRIKWHWKLLPPDALYSHIHVVNTQLAVEMFPDVTTEPHRLRERQHFQIDEVHTIRRLIVEMWGLRSRLFPQTYLSLLDGVGRSLFEQLDGLVVVLSAAATDHVS